MGLGSFGGGNHFLFSRLGPAVADVIAHGARKEDRFLGNNANLSEQ